ncbi:hypothetical protein [Pectobacterium polaris]|uniref:hypothetical protein n=1 Tax=Pectobacterium polaris TaxID=2042057 RepID=UPI0013FDF462|nr:hypothetical protein [Pectobacterium polaris]
MNDETVDLEKIKSDLNKMDTQIYEIVKGSKDRNFNLFSLLQNGRNDIYPTVFYNLWRTVFNKLNFNIKTFHIEAKELIDQWFYDKDTLYVFFNPNILEDEGSKWELLEYLYEFCVKVHFYSGGISNNDVFDLKLLERLNELSSKSNVNFLDVVQRASYNSFLTFSRSNDFIRIQEEIKKQEQSNHDLKASVTAIQQGQGKAEKLKEQIDKLNIDTNNILLSQAYYDMLSDKRTEKNSILYTCQALGFFCIFVPFVVIISHDVIFKWIDPNQGIRWYGFALYISPVVFIEFALLYFFRISYSELRGLNAQIIQIQVRLSACKFIGDYVKQKQIAYNEALFGKPNAFDDIRNLYIRMKEGDADITLEDIGMVKFPEEFEKLIFSPIQTSGDNIPAALDGVNSIAELAGKVMSAKK